MQDGVIFGKIFAGLITLSIAFFGLVMAVNPKIMSSFTISANRKKVKVSITPATWLVYRVFGGVFFLAGIMLFLVAVTSRW